MEGYPQEGQASDTFHVQGAVSLEKGEQEVPGTPIRGPESPVEPLSRCGTHVHRCEGATYLTVPSRAFLG